MATQAKRAGCCVWREDSDGFWKGDCGIAWELFTGTPKENKMNYCPECGKLIKEKP